VSSRQKEKEEEDIAPGLRQLFPYLKQLMAIGRGDGLPFKLFGLQNYCKFNDMFFLKGTLWRNLRWV
jgi:hypothetical protein